MDHHPDAAADDRLAALRIAQAIAPIEPAAFGPVLDALAVRALAAGERLLAVGDAGGDEYFVLQGILKSSVGDAEGRESTLAFHTGPGIVTPAIARVVDGRSRVDCTALTAARVAAFPNALLMDCMRRDAAMQRWGDGVLRAELVRRADREWALAALSAAERLRWLRHQQPGLEERVAHHHIASHLGITPVTFSRLRAQLRGA